ncbi:MAG: YfhO family protein [Hespellia sp.]|nr:YfhO family protein [Hespellia sp.]
MNEQTTRNRFEKKEYIYCIILVTIPLLLFLYQIAGGYLAGSRMDWISQHSVFPDYFRKLYYQTGNLLPSYAAEIGGGQNIWNFAYYGLYNPLFFMSYLFPWMKMSVYMQLISILGQMADGILCFVWLKKHFEKADSFYATFFLSLASPIIYHSSTQIMFVDYMPFLLLTFIGYDYYKEREKYGLMVSGVFCMILTSFYFSIGGLGALFFYGLCDTDTKIQTFPGFVQRMWHRFYPVLLGIMLSLFYLVPTYCALKGGRSQKQSFSLKELLLPDASVTKYLYSPYGMGVTAVAVIAIVTSLFVRKSREKWLSSILLILILCPMFEWLLNGSLYIRSKALIPFLPLICYVLAGYFGRMKSGELTSKWVTAGYVLAGGVLLWGAIGVENPIRWLLCADFILCGVVILVSRKRWKNALCLASAAMMIMSGIYGVVRMKSYLVKADEVFKRDDVRNQDTIAELLAQDGRLCRIEMRGSNSENKESINKVQVNGQNLTSCYSSLENSSYTQFRKDQGLPCSTRNSLMENVVDNPIFLRIMGVRYLVGNVDIVGYQHMQSKDNSSVYENQKVAPLFYFTNQTISPEIYKKMSWAQKELALLETAVTTDSTGIVEKKLTDAALHLDSFTGKEGRIVAQNDTLHIELNKKVTQKLKIDNLPEQSDRNNNYIFLSFTVANQVADQDVTVEVNGQKNKLTSRTSDYYNENTVFHYTCPMTEETADLTVVFGAGSYDIKNIQCQTGREDAEKNQRLYQSPVVVSRLESGDGYTGKIDVKEDTNMITSIPYDSNFQIYVDGKAVDSQKVNTAFLGTKIKKGKHKLKIVYSAPGSKMGGFLSVFSLLIAAGDCARRWRRKNGTISK